MSAQKSRRGAVEKASLRSADAKSGRDRPRFAAQPGWSAQVLKKQASVTQARKAAGTDPGLLRKPLGQSLLFA
ncbi:MAG: hypothetical protein R6V12_18700, partial [Candidatus Hydrogenedentota bacterium]